MIKIPSKLLVEPQALVSRLAFDKNKCGAHQTRSTQLASANPRKTGLDHQSRQPTQRWWSDCGKASAKVTGNSARTDGLHPSLALGLYSTEAADGRSGWPTGHPAAAMEKNRMTFQKDQHLQLSAIGGKRSQAKRFSLTRAVAVIIGSRGRRP